MVNSTMESKRYVAANLTLAMQEVKRDFGDDAWILSSREIRDEGWLGLLGKKKVEVMIHSFENAGGKGPSCLCEMTPSQVVTRCADNALWAVANNATEPYAAWGSFVARPDGTTAQRLPRGRAGMLIHDFPDVIPENGWLHNKLPLKLSRETPMCYGKPSNHARQTEGTSEP